MFKAIRSIFDAVCSITALIETNVDSLQNLSEAGKVKSASVLDAALFDRKVDQVEMEAKLAKFEAEQAKKKK